MKNICYREIYSSRFIRSAEIVYVRASRGMIDIQKFISRAIIYYYNIYITHILYTIYTKLGVYL